MMYLASGGGAPAATTGPAKVHVSNTTSAATFAAPTIGVPAGSHQEVPPRQGGEGSTSSDESFVYVRGASDCDSPSPPLGTERQQQQTESLTVALGGDGPTTIAFDAKGEETRNTPIADKAEERIAAKPEIVATIVVAESATDAEAELVEFLASLDMASLADTLHKHGVRSLEALFAIATDDSPQGKAAYKAVVTQAGPRTRLKTAVVSKAKHSEPLQVALNSTKQNAEENSPSETKSNARVAAEEAGAGAGEKALTMAQDVTETAAPEPNGPAVEETKHVVHAAEADVAPSAAQADIPSPSPSPSSPLDAFYRRFTGDTASPVAARVAAAYLSGSCPLLGDEKEPTAQPSEKAPHVAEEDRAPEAAQLNDEVARAAAQEAAMQQRAREEEENQRRRVAEEEAVKKRVESLSLPLRTLLKRAGLTFDEQVDIAATGTDNATALRKLCNSDPALRAVLTDAASRERLRGLLKTAEDGIYCAESEKADQSKWQAHNEVAMSSALLLLLDTQGVAWSVERLAGGSLEIELIETLRDLCHEQNAADDFAGAFPDANERRQLTAAVDSALASRKDTAALKEFLCSESLKMGPLVGTLPNHGVRSLEALFALARDDSPQGRSAFGKVVTKLGWRGDLKKAAAACTSNASSRTADKKADPPSQQQQHAVEKLSPCLAEFLTRRDLKDLAERLLRADVMNLSTLFGLALEDNGASERFKTVVPFALRAKICLEAKAAQAAGGVPTATTTTTTAVTAPPAKGPQADLAALLEKAKATEWAATLDIEGGVHTIADLELIALDEKHSVLWKGLVTEDAARGRIEEELFTLRRGATRAPARPSPAVLSPSHPAPTLSAKGRPQQSAAQKQKTALQTPPPTAANGHQQQVTTAQAPSQTANDDKPTLSAKGRPQHGKAAPQAETQPAAVPPAQTLPQKTLRAAGRSAAPAAMPQRPAQRSNSDVAAVAAADPPRSPRPKKGMTAAQRRNMRNATPTAPLVDDDYSYYDAYSSAAPAAAAVAAALHAEGDDYASRSVYAFDEAREAPLFVDGENNLANDIEAQRALEATFAAGLAIAAEEAAVFGMTVEEYMLVQRQNEASLALALQLSRE